MDTQQGGARWVASVSIGSGAGSNLQRIVSSCDRGFDKDLVHLLSNSANLAMFMVNVSHALIGAMRVQWPAFSVNDLKAWFRGQKYVVETLKLLPVMPDSVFIDQVVSQMAELGRVNHAVNTT